MGKLRRGLTITSAIMIIVVIPVWWHLSKHMTVLLLTNKPVSVPLHAHTVNETIYDDVKCITENSNTTCTFPLLTDYHRQCGYFAGLTSWAAISDGYPRASMSAQLCRVPSVTSAPSRLNHYIKHRNISSIVLFGDSQGKRYSLAFFGMLKDTGFHCKTTKLEKSGERIQLNYYTEGSMFMPKDTIARTCASCTSELRLCSDESGHEVSVEYISMIMASATAFGGHCNDTQNPLCQNTTQQEYVLKHYLRRTNNYPQLLLFFSTFGHDSLRPLAETYNGIRFLHNFITLHVPASSTVIWYTTSAFHPRQHNKWYTSEGSGYSPNDKIQAENHLLSKLLIEHHVSGKTPAMYSFFDLYHMDEQLRGAWDADKVHYKPNWYIYVMRYTATMLPSIPQNKR